MAGRAKRQALREELVRRAIVELGEEATPLDYVIERIAAGTSLKELTEELNATSPYQFYPAQVKAVCGEYARDESELEERFRGARAIAAELFVEESKSLADNVIPTKEHVAKAKLQISTRQWIAERYNRDAFGQPKQQVSISIGSLHLDSLRKAPPPRPELAAPSQPALPAPEPLDVEVL